MPLDEAPRRIASGMRAKGHLDSGSISMDAETCSFTSGVEAEHREEATEPLQGRRALTERVRRNR